MKLFLYVLLWAVCLPASAQERDCGTPVEDCGKEHDFWNGERKRWNKADVLDAFAVMLTDYKELVPTILNFIRDQTETHQQLPIEFEEEERSMLRRILNLNIRSERQFNTTLNDLDITERCLVGAVGIVEENEKCLKDNGKRVPYDLQYQLNNLRERQKAIAIDNGNWKAAYAHLCLLQGKLQILNGWISSPIWNSKNIDMVIDELAELIETSLNDPLLHWLYELYSERKRTAEAMLAKAVKYMEQLKSNTKDSKSRVENAAKLRTFMYMERNPMSHTLRKDVSDAFMRETSYLLEYD